MKSSMTRRDCLLQCAALGSLRLMPGLALTDAVVAAESRERDLSLKPTPRNEIGPFYKRLAPNNAHLRPANAPGLPRSVSGRVLSTHADSLAAAKVEIWHADHLGRYDLDRAIPTQSMRALSSTSCWSGRDAHPRRMR